MGGFFDQITEEQADLIRSSAVFFIATADPQLQSGPKNVGPINLSPKGATLLHIITPNRVAYLDYAGSGNETARHATAGGPTTIMVCSFEDADCAIVRLYGRASAVPFEDSPIAERLLESPAADLKLSPRQVIEVEVEQTQTSCGYGVPLMSFARERRVADRGRRFKDDAQFAVKDT